LGGEIPPKPEKVSDRNYEIFLDHIRDGKGYETISYLHRGPDGELLSRQRVLQIIDQVITWAARERRAQTGLNQAGMRA
jgi:hypothetical protein